MQIPHIPTFASDGKRIRAYSLEAVQRLESLSLVVCRRNRRGEIAACFFRPQDGANPLKATCNMGQKYSYLEHVGDNGARAWSHKPLLQSQDIEQLTGIPLDSPQDLDLYLRGIFRGVALSCVVSTFDGKPEMAPPSRPKVEGIDAARKRIAGKQSKRRPIEYDSEKRAA